jgi:post-segregation antitoxin (ccd killing protein)
MHTSNLKVMMDQVRAQVTAAIAEDLQQVSPVVETEEEANVVLTFFRVASDDLHEAEWPIGEMAPECIAILAITTQEGTAVHAMSSGEELSDGMVKILMAAEAYGEKVYIRNEGTEAARQLAASTIRLAQAKMAVELRKKQLGWWQQQNAAIDVAGTLVAMDTLRGAYDYGTN